MSPSLSSTLLITKFILEWSAVTSFLGRKKRSLGNSNDERGWDWDWDARRNEIALWTCKLYFIPAVFLSRKDICHIFDSLSNQPGQKVRMRNIWDSFSIFCKYYGNAWFTLDGRSIRRCLSNTKGSFFLFDIEKFLRWFALSQYKSSICTSQTNQ